MRVEEVIGSQIARLRAQRQLSLTDLGQALGRYLGRPWSRQAVHQAERGQRSFTAAELTALALALDTSVQVLFRAETAQIELPGLVVSPEQYRGILLNREKDAPLDGVEEMIIALHDIGEVLSRPALARLARIGRAAEQAAGPGQPCGHAARVPVIIVADGNDGGGQLVRITMNRRRQATRNRPLYQATALSPDDYPVCCSARDPGPGA